MSFPFSVLLVEDQPTTALVARRVLEQIGFAGVEHASEGEAVLSILENENFGLVLSDLHMKPMGGLALLRAMRADPRLRQVRFIVTSVDWSAEAIMQAKEAGADAYLLKPFNARILSARINAIMRPGISHADWTPSSELLEPAMS